MAAKGKSKGKTAGAYHYPNAESLLRPDVGTQAQFTKKKPPKSYRYDSSLSPALEWDEGNLSRELGEWLIGLIEEATRLDPPHMFPELREFRNSQGVALATVRSLQDAIDQLKRVSKPFLNWAGKAERLSFEVPTLPLFVHERLSTKAILETLKGHRRDKQMDMFELFGDPQLAIHDQILRAYEHKGGWTNRLILGDSLSVMNSLLEYEGLSGQVQMIYMDPPYGVKFGSNFQPFVRKRDVTHNDDDDFTREPEMVKAYRDTWELGVHSYLTYLRDRLLLCRELLNPSGSIFVQIGIENVHLLRNLLDEIFGTDNHVGQIVYRKKQMPLGSKLLENTHDVIIWYAKDKQYVRFRQLFKGMSVEGDNHWNMVHLPDGAIRKMTTEEINNHLLLPPGSRVFRLLPLYPAGFNANAIFPVHFNGKTIYPPKGKSWKTSESGMQRLLDCDRLTQYEDGETLQYITYLDDYCITPVLDIWTDTAPPSEKIYAVQTTDLAIERCLLMTTDPGDLVLDTTCGSGTTAYVSEQWGRRWITVDVSRVPLALARQRLLTATFPYYELKEEAQGPAGGFVYVRKQNKKGEEVGGIVPHITLESIANNEPPKEEILVDRPGIDNKITRVTGPFCVEATIPTPVDWEPSENSGEVNESAESYSTFAIRMLEVLRKSPVLRIDGGKTVTFKNVRAPAKTLSLSAEALVANGDEKVVTFVFGPENGAVSEKLVYEAAREAHAKNYSHLYVTGFSIQPNARILIENCEAAVGIPATYVQVTPDITMGDLLKNMRSSQIFSVCGLPEIKIIKVKSTTKGETTKYQVELLGLDVFDPATMTTDHRKGLDVPAWFLDTDYNDLSFHVSQAFFPRTSAWDSLKKALKGEYEEQVWNHLAGTISAPFETGENGKVAVKVIDDRGNELLVVKRLEEATP